MAKSGDRNIKLKSTESDEFYYSTKNKKQNTGRLELKKYDKKLRRHVIFKETK
jgi:large subunit ribosomal protein L33